MTVAVGTLADAVGRAPVYVHLCVYLFEGDVADTLADRAPLYVHLCAYVKADAVARWTLTAPVT